MDVSGVPVKRMVIHMVKPILTENQDRSSGSHTRDATWERNDAYIGLAFATIVVGSNRYGWTEAERLKFLIEVPLVLFSIQGIRLLYEAFRIMIYRAA
jgi:hypothetical protein